ncbi:MULTISPECIES: family 43 glycosylhydrolase [unclassified Microbacterium]|uniref:family 43 glycosylhydrolase n=1 Tax=unclassified Microbacterium TaxID=2609290 RepID=UPI00214B5167|nr:MULTISPECIES: family 43 glycosylhydrolase [unclassified Microbacterium]MCR2808531.1 family 43 glycosylhydrolase [Microbacterium sp. zg.B185]WIM19029.1 family 43 glycosylhydrolase [Microbacterium sp. zg-B185]
MGVARGDRIGDAVTTYINPVLAGDRPDPAVLQVGDQYWLTYSSFEAAPGLPLYRSTDLVNWTYETSALHNPVGNTFAVDLAEHDGRFFIYIPFIPTPWSTLTDAAIFVIHADAMSGPWSEPIDLGIRGVIDPGHVVGEDGRRYLFTSGVRRIRLTDDGLSTVGELEYVYDGWRYPEDWVTEAYALEGPKLFWRASARRRSGAETQNGTGGWFYLVSAVGGTAGPPTGHMVIVARSRSVHGPWQNHPRNPIARTEDAAEAWWSRGHATLVPGPAGTDEDDWWMISHGYENGYRTLGRQILLEPIRWGEDDWPEAVVHDLGAPIDAPVGAAEQSAAPDLADDFAQPDLGRRWAFHAPDRGEAERVRVDDGLILRAKGSSPADTSPLAMLTGDHAYEIEVEVTVQPGVEAGLLLFFNDRLFCGMGVDGERMQSYSGGIRTHWREPAPATDRMTLRIRNDEHIVTGWYRVPGGAWTRHGVRYETSGYHANTVGDLLSLRPALFATGTGEARFREFAYRSLR